MEDEEEDKKKTDKDEKMKCEECEKRSRKIS
jgi:hypothetical protein